MANIFTINSWNLGSSYFTNDFVKYNGRIYYALKNIDENTAFSLSNFGGHYKENVERPLFLWTPSFQSEASVSPKVDVTEFGGMEQRSAKQTNIDSITLDLSFSNRDDRECAAILNFLYNRNGVESFYFNPIYPYNTLSLFVCEEWSHTAKFNDNNMIKAKFVEVFN